MANSIIDRDSRWDRLFEPLAQHVDVCDDSGNLVGSRMDVSTVQQFMVYDAPTAHDAVSLFWNMYQPRLMVIPSAADREDYVRRNSRPLVSAEERSKQAYRLYRPLAPVSSAELDRLLLDCLDWVYDKFQVPYEPDADNSEKLLDLVIELHIAAARAFSLKRVEQGRMSEEWVSRLRAVEHTMKRIRAIVNPHGSPGYGNPSFAVSTDAIWGLTQLELSRVSKADGSYADAIHYLDQASTSYTWSLDGIEDMFGDAGPVDRDSRNSWVNTLNWDDESIKLNEGGARLELKNRLTPLQVSLKEAASLFNLLKQSPSSDINWRRIVDDCFGLSILTELEWEVFSGVIDGEVIEDEETGLPLSWSEFWHSARAWASAQLSPSEYRKMREDDLKHAAETRLKNYFFFDTWPELPERAKRHLINADILLNSKQSVALEALLNELRVATEEICYRAIWRPLNNTKTPPLEFIREKLKLDERQGRSDLSISDYIRICRAQWYREFMNRQNLDNDDIKFLTKQLPRDMSRLRIERNVAEHKTGMSAAPDGPQSFYRGFLGIGRKGVLPELARIGGKLQRRPRR